MYVYVYRHVHKYPGVPKKTEKNYSSVLVECLSSLLPIMMSKQQSPGTTALSAGSGNRSASTALAKPEELIKLLEKDLRYV